MVTYQLLGAQSGLFDIDNSTGEAPLCPQHSHPGSVSSSWGGREPAVRSRASLLSSGPGSSWRPQSPEPQSYSWIRPPMGQVRRPRRKLGGPHKGPASVQILSLDREPPTHSLHLPMPTPEAQAPSQLGAAKALSSNQTQSSPAAMSHRSGPRQQVNPVTGGTKERYTSTSLCTAGQSSTLGHSFQAGLRRTAEGTRGWDNPGRLAPGDLPKYRLLSFWGRKSLIAFSARFVSFTHCARAFQCSLLVGSRPLSALDPFSSAFPRLMALGVRCGDSEVRCCH